MRHERSFSIGVMLLVVLVGAPALGQVDLVCPTCESGPVPLDYAQVVSLILGTVFENGVSILLFGATTAVGVPWLVAGVAILLFYVPRWLKASS